MNGTPLVRIIHPGKTHNRYEWHEGVNVDPLPFRPSGDCNSGGLYFTTPEWVLNYKDRNNSLNDHYIGQIKLAADEPVWQEETGYQKHGTPIIFLKWKAHTVTLVNMTKICDMSDEEYYNLIGHHVLKKSPEPYDKSRPREQWLNLIDVKPKIIKYVRKQDPYMCLMAVMKNAKALKHVQEPYHDMCQTILGKNYSSVKTITDIDLIHRMLGMNGMILSHIPRQIKTQEMVDIAVDNNPDAARYAGKKFLTKHPELFFHCYSYYPNEKFAKKSPNVVPKEESKEEVVVNEIPTSEVVVPKIAKDILLLSQNNTMFWVNSSPLAAMDPLTEQLGCLWINRESNNTNDQG